MGQRSCIQVTLDAPRDLERLPTEVELVLFRVLQEGLTNVHRHSGATVAQVAVRKETGQVTLEVKDNGCGMRPEIKRQVFDPFFTTRRDQGSTGLGLHIVHNIVTNRLGGRINLDTKPGAGTKIRIIVPREAPLAAE